MDDPLGPDQPSHATSCAILCCTCNTWINGSDAWVTHITGRAHRRRANPKPDSAFSSHEQFWAQQAAR
eukprot:767397-Lingulodinium_polyedra.AAC.1